MATAQPIIYNRLAAARIERGIERFDLARVVGVTAQLLGYVELGTYQPDLALALRLAEALSLPLERVFSLHPFEKERGPRLV
jgi:DNA-binding XRE family transcriptional regulator